MVARNVDEAIETLQSCLRLLDGVNKVGDLIKQGHYFAGLRVSFLEMLKRIAVLTRPGICFPTQSLEELNRLPPSAISETPFHQHIVSSLPSLRAEIKSAVTESEKSWLFDVRQSGAMVGRLALDHMEARQRRWRTKKEREREKEGVAALTARSLRVGSAVELVNNEKVECKLCWPFEPGGWISTLVSSTLQLTPCRTTKSISISNRSSNAFIYIKLSTARASCSGSIKRIGR
jgi:hypothetical protein